MEVQIHIEYPYRKDIIKIPTPMELQIDLECPRGENLFAICVFLFPNLSFRIRVSLFPNLSFRICGFNFRLLVSESACVLVSESAVLVSESALDRARMVMATVDMDTATTATAMAMVMVTAMTVMTVMMTTAATAATTTTAVMVMDMRMARMDIGRAVRALLVRRCV